jgi:signal transduction histidine kinase
MAWYYARFTTPEGETTEFANTDARTPVAFRALSSDTAFLENNGWTTTGPSYHLWSVDYEAGDLTLYIAIRQDYIDVQRANWHALRQELVPMVISAANALLTIVLLTVYLSFVTGRRAGSDELHLSPLDRLFSDLNLVLMAGIAVLWAFSCAALVEALSMDALAMGATIAGCAAATVVAAPLLLALWLSMMRNIKAGRLLRHTLIFTCGKWVFLGVATLCALIGRFFRNLFGGSAFAKYPFARALACRQGAFIVTCACLVPLFYIGLFFDGFWWLAVAAGIAGVCMIAFYTDENAKTFMQMEKICDQVYEIFSGNLEYNPGLPPGGQLYATQNQLLDIGGGMEKAMTQKLSSERMKVALITNVSHDLKTPLTSIISYIDLLSREDSLTPEARDFVAILQNKSARLKSIIEDLFDLAKTTSGDDSSLHVEQLDLRRLTEQTLADMEDKIAGSNRAVRPRLPEEPVAIMADGGKLYRVMQNILDNALKYSMVGTRVYIDLAIDGRDARLSVANTAGYEMGFTAEEVLERFARGDASRSPEGSGLGLSIADGFVKAMGGALQLSIDGDQFKVTLRFPLAAPPLGPLPEGAEPPAIPASTTPALPAPPNASGAARGEPFHRAGRRQYQPPAGTKIPVRVIHPTERGKDSADTPSA